MQPPIKLWQSLKSVFTPRPSPEEENAHCLALAEEFDKLVTLSGWAKVVEHLAERVNREITEATENPMKPRTQTLHVIRWNAQRELLDEALNFVNSTRKQRDEILAIKREEEEYVNSVRNSR